MNPWRGEVALIIDGQSHVMRLTLGALAVLETRLEADSLMAMIDRFETGQFRAGDLLELLAAGLRGAGASFTAEMLGDADIEGGPVAAARAAAELLHLTFAVPNDGAP